jgi:hypothetical protein
MSARVVDLARWVSSLDAVVELIGRRFSCSEQRVRAGTYVRGLLADLERDADWNPRGAEEFEALQERLVAAPRWLIEGNYAGVLPIRLASADTVIFLDLPALTCRP